MSLNIETLEKLIKALDKSINIYYSYKEYKNKYLVETIAAGVIRNFKISYENSWKLIARWLDENISSDTSHKLRKKDYLGLQANIF